MLHTAPGGALCAARGQGPREEPLVVPGGSICFLTSYWLNRVAFFSNHFYRHWWNSVYCCCFTAVRLLVHSLVLCGVLKHGWGATTVQKQAWFETKLVWVRMNMWWTWSPIQGVFCSMCVVPLQQKQPWMFWHPKVAFGMRKVLIRHCCTI